MFFARKKILIIFTFVAVLIIGLLFQIKDPFANISAAVLGSIVSSIVVSSFYNESLHSAMDKYKKVGLVNYFESYEKAQHEIKNKISKAKSVDIFVMYGDSFLKTSTDAIQLLLSKENSTLRYFIYNSNNEFINAYGTYWGGKGINKEYNSDGIKLKINNVKESLSRLNVTKNKKSSFKLFEIQNAPVSYSFYKIDDDLYFVPSKNISAKEIKPPVFHFSNRGNKYSMFYKIEKELDLMINRNEVIEIAI